MRGSFWFLDTLRKPLLARIQNVPLYRVLRARIGAPIFSSEQYAYLVPFVEEADYYFLKTAIPNRKATRDYLKGGV